MTLDPSSWPGGGGGGSTSSFLTVTAQIPSASLLTLDTIPVQVVAAPGAGKSLFPLHFFATTHGTVAYNATDAMLAVGNSGNGPLLSGVGDVLQFAPPAYVVAPLGECAGALSAAENLPMLVRCTIPLTGGDSDLTMTVYYAVVNV